MAEEIPDCFRAEAFEEEDVLAVQEPARPNGHRPLSRDERLELWDAEHDEANHDQILERLVSSQLQQMRARDEAQRRYTAEKLGHITVPAVVPLDAFLAVPDEDAVYRIDRVLPVGARIMLAAQYKAGKSTAVANLIRSLVDGDPFLGQYRTDPIGSVVLIDDELDERTLRRWLRAQGIRNTGAVRVVPLKGRLFSFGIIDADTRTAWANALRGAQFLVLDCLRPVLDALGLDENHDAGKFLVALDELLGEAGIPEALVVQHMGHQGERQRGDSRMLDWPDATWKIVREDPDDPSTPVYFSAFGRDVEVKETLLEYDAATRRLSLGEGSRKDAKVLAAMAAVLALLDDNDALSGRKVEDLLRDTEHTQKDVRAALHLAHQTGQTITYGGPRNAIMHSLNRKDTP